MDTIGFERHDHARCIRGGLASVERYCATQGLHFTPVRRRVFEILLREHRAIGAYDILDILRAEDLGSQPPVVYRALDFLMRHGFAHRIERLNAFVACAHMGHDHVPTFLICRACAHVAEAQADPARGPLGRAAKGSGFAIEQAAVEAVGLCPACQDATACG